MEAMKELITGQKTMFQLPLYISSIKLSSKHVLLHQVHGQVFQGNKYIDKNIYVEVILHYGNDIFSG